MSECAYCKKEYLKGKNSLGKYCSNKCQGLEKTEFVIKRWMQQPTVENYYSGNQVRPSIRRHLIEQSNFKCVLCGWGEKHHSSQMPPLEMDHIDGDWKNCQPLNLRVICPNCHSLTDSYKSRNKGKGRHGRKKCIENG